MPFSSPGDLCNLEIKPTSPALAGGFFTTEPLRKPNLFPRMIVINLSSVVKGASLVAQLVKNLPAMRETRVPSLGWEDKEVATHSIILAWRVPGTGEPGGLQSMGLQRSPGEENGNPLLYSCLGNPMDRGGWQATVHGVSKSQT